MQSTRRRISNVVETNIQSAIVLAQTQEQHHHGGGYKEGAEQWIRKQANKKGGRLCRVFSLKEFREHVKKGEMG